MQLKNISRLHEMPAQGIGMDIIIISVDNPAWIDYWEKRLSAMRDHVIKHNVRICCVYEDWPGGAGTGLGTLYAYQKAREKLLARDDVDITEKLIEGASIAIYHTAGTGKRLYPLTASEYGNKAAVKLPSLVNGKFLTILEGVLKQTGSFAPVRKGRLSIFWGDQIFISAHPMETRSKAHIEILALMDKLPTENEWNAKNMSSYGYLIQDGNGRVKLLEKTKYPLMKKISESLAYLGDVSGGISLGSLSLSSEMLMALLEEFSLELREKKIKMDFEPYFWMPLSLERENYFEAMSGEGFSKEQLNDIYQRIYNFKIAFNKTHDDKIFGFANIGKESFWWDYGSLEMYKNNNLKVCGSNLEAQAMREFLQMENPVSHSRLGASSIHNSVVIGVTADKLRLSNSLLINSEVNTFEGENTLLYNVVEDLPQHFSKGTVRSDLFIPSKNEHIKMSTQMARDGKEDWLVHLEGNVYSYEELHELTYQIDPTAMEKFSAKLHKAY